MSITPRIAGALRRASLLATILAAVVWLSSPWWSLTAYIGTPARYDIVDVGEGRIVLVHQAYSTDFSGWSLSFDGYWLQREPGTWISPFGFHHHAPDPSSTETIITIPLLFAFTAAAILTGILYWRARFRAINDAAPCPRCAYSLLNLSPNSPCPECGHTTTPRA